MSSRCHLRESLFHYYFFFILVNLGIIWGGGEWEKARHGGRPGDLRPPRLRGGTGGPVPGRSPQPDPELFSLPRFYFLKFLIFYFIPVPDFPGGRWGRPPRSAPGCGRAGRSWQRPAVLGRGVGRGIRPGKIPIPAMGFFWGQKRYRFVPPAPRTALPRTFLTPLLGLRAEEGEAPVNERGLRFWQHGRLFAAGLGQGEPQAWPPHFPVGARRGVHGDQGRGCPSLPGRGCSPAAGRAAEAGEASGRLLPRVNNCLSPINPTNHY